MICLYNALMTTEAGNPSCDMMDSAFSLISGSTRARTFALFVAIEILWWRISLLTIEPEFCIIMNIVTEHMFVVGAINFVTICIYSTRDIEKILKIQMSKIRTPQITYLEIRNL